MGAIYLLTIQYNVILKLLRVLFFFLDALIYSLIPLIYDLIKTLADITLIADETVVIGTIADNIYSLLAIYMFFRLAFSLLNFLVNPDRMADKEKGAGKIVTSIVVCLILTIAMPVVFDYAGKLQSNIIENDVIENIFSECKKNEAGLCETVDFGDYVSTKTLGVFVTLLSPELLEEKHPNAAAAYNAVFEENTGSFKALWQMISYIHWDTTYDQDFSDEASGTNISAGTHVFWFAYLPVVSTIVGIFLVYSFLIMCIEVASRSVKLFVLRVISPIAIVSYIDPSSGSKGVFKRWMDEYIKTYVSLFVRLAILAFITLVITNLDITRLNDSKNPFVVLFIILGLISFVKSAPKMFENLFGFKSGGDSWGNAIVKKGMGFAGHATAAGVGTALGSGVGSLAGGISSAAQGLGFRAGLGVGAWSGAKSGMKAGWSAKGLKGVGKTLGAGWSGRKATQDRYGYKGFEDNWSEKRKYNQEQRLADSVVEDYKGAYENEEVKNGAIEHAQNTLAAMNSNHGMVDFRREDVEVLRKAHAKAAGYSNMYKSKNYASSAGKLAKASAEKQVFDRNLRRMQQNYTSASTASERKYYKEKFDKLVSAEGLFNKAYDDAKKEFDAYDKNPKYAKDHQTKEMFDRADAMDQVKVNFYDVPKDPEDDRNKAWSNGMEEDAKRFAGPNFDSAEDTNGNPGTGFGSSGTGTDWDDYT